jgi:probable F420-dependent oxidoreductase
MTWRGSYKPFRFGTGAEWRTDPEEIRAVARRAEDLGYATFGMADHFMLPFAPLIGLQAVADVTTTIRLTQTVLNQDLRRPAVLAKELATLDVFSAGRLQVGIGAGWMQSEYDQTGMHYDKGSVRIERLEEVVIVLKGLFGAEPFSFSGKHIYIDALDGLPKPRQKPYPPIMIGGGGAKLLAVAARQAEIIQVQPRIPGGALSMDGSEFTEAAFRQKVGWIRDAAGDRFDEIELGVLLLNVTITEDIDQALNAFAADYQRRARQLGGTFALTREEMLASPVVAVGSLPQICDKLLEVRETLGFSYFTSPVGTPPESLAPIIERLAGK